jgi:purine-binding chemotaxis protein CheW
MDAIAEQPNADQTTTEQTPQVPVADEGLNRDVVCGMYLTFSLGKEEYGIDILKVRELIGIMDITPVPHTHDYVQGVINLRGKVIPVLDLRSKFNLERADYTEQTCIIVVDVGVMTGIIVDSVEEVYDIPAEDIEPAPAVGAGVATSFILGMGKVEKEVKILLDIEQVVLSEPLVATRVDS